MKPHDETLLLDTPFAAGMRRACQLRDWGAWKGYAAPNAYEDVEQEYFALRNAAGVFDLSPMTKYRIAGPDAEAFLNRLLTRNVGKIAAGRVGYCVWCNDAGMVLDDGTLFHLGEGDYRLCAQERCLDWLHWSALGFDVRIQDETAAVAALAVQGPTSCAALRALGLDGLQDLKPFALRRFAFDGGELLASRTGFTGDLGYELWTAPDHANALWDALFKVGGTSCSGPSAWRPWTSPASRRASSKPGRTSCRRSRSCAPAGAARPSSWAWAGWSISARGRSPAAAPCCGNGSRVPASASCSWMWRGTSRRRTPSY